ncbi:flagellar hook-basal body complex protein FliE [Clostridium oryzae]|uniref:Flagellar hook-basal body complex protein FliE n=1 Tax=Clostridium oryzae TaxID=1450648 RepID=A0A1V4ITZ0_9CLOT|nr:flagellar hook-basal body complex protein FliE [Clostridium oryzae]OPJ63280.1 flagellar hook-basal body complex protein FliE [Clostridium oryzae]
MQISNDFVRGTLAALNGSTQTNSSNVNNTSASGVDSFASLLTDKLDQVNNKQLKADSDTESFIKGDNINIHQVMLSTEEAKLSLETAVQIRNKLVEAYQEINRMQL